jgi:hypothetical protein
VDREGYFWIRLFARDCRLSQMLSAFPRDQISLIVPTRS